MAYELPEPLLIQLRVHGPSQGGGHTCGGGHFELLRPSVENNIVSQAHTQLRIARTNETKRFPGWAHPSTSDYMLQCYALGDCHLMLTS